MTPDQESAYIIARSVCTLAIIESMRGENEVRLSNGGAPVYHELSFSDEIHRLQEELRAFCNSR